MTLERLRQRRTICPFTPRPILCLPFLQFLCGRCAPKFRIIWLRVIATWPIPDTLFPVWTTTRSILILGVARVDTSFARLSTSMMTLSLQEGLYDGYTAYHISAAHKAPQQLATFVRRVDPWNDLPITNNTNVLWPYWRPNNKLLRLLYCRKVP